MPFGKPRGICRKRSRAAEPKVAYHAVFGQRTADGGWSLRVGRELRTPNKTLWAPWWMKKKDRDDWEIAIRNALVSAYSVMTWHAFNEKRGPAETRMMHLTVIREVPSTKHFIRDRMNRVFAAKHVHDALTSCGVIKDDDERWLVAPDPQQQISDDGKFWTVIALRPANEQEMADATKAEIKEGRVRTHPRAKRGGEAAVRDAG